MRLALLLAALCLMLSAAAHAALWYDAKGFEDMTLGPINGQDGWTGSSTAGGVAPEIVAFGGSQAARLYVGDTQGDVSYMDKAIADPVAAGYTIITVSYDIYRTGSADTDQNLWWWWFDAGEPTYGLQWDSDGTLPHGWNAGAGSAATVFGAFANVTMTWDLAAGKAYSWYDSVQVDDGIPLSDITELTGWAFNFGHESATGTGADTLYIDNFVMTASGLVPEPGSMLALASGLLGLGGLAIRRRK